MMLRNGSMSRSLRSATRRRFSKNGLGTSRSSFCLKTEPCLRFVASATAAITGDSIMPIIKALRTTITDGVQNYPIFLGYLSAAELVSVAAVPSFTGKSQNFEIANNILGDPVKDWQRPPIAGKVDAIKTRFSQTAEIMPNPVLLAVSNTSLV